MSNYSLSTIEMVADGSKEFILKMVESFVRNAPISMDEMVDAYNKKSFTELARHAHKLKPSIDMMEMGSLRDDIRTIESKAKVGDLTGLDVHIENMREKIAVVIEELCQDFDIKY